MDLWCGILWHAAGRQLPTQCPRFCEAELLIIFFRVSIWKCHSPVDPWCGSLAYMQREGNCPLNARARALGAVKEAIAYSMAALLLAEKLGTFI